MSFGKMRAFIEIIRKKTTTDDECFSITKNVTVARVRAYHDARKGTEKWANRATFSTSTDLFQFRAIPNVRVTTDMCILYDGRVFEITSVEDVRDRGMYVEVLTQEVSPSG